ncbi:MAG TPA: transglycosylase SLT domain-containing protein, partial [Nitrospiria bacterium]|nr:transglycosylase SLT domain-containing protein [Nitrospiria bacterium]
MAFAENDASIDSQADNTLIINRKEPLSSLEKEPGSDSTALKDLLNEEGQIKTDYNNVPVETTNSASDPGVKLNIDTTFNQEQEDLNGPEMTIVINKHVVNHITYFQTRMKDRFTLWLSRSSLYIPMMRRVLREYALPEDLVYISLIESGFNPNAYSRAKAAGTWQFIKSTGKKYGLR